MTTNQGPVRILTDFTPDTTGTLQSTLIYNSAIGNARWMSLESAISPEFTIEVVTVDWLGETRPLQLDSAAGIFTMKLCFIDAL
jgi:hypothetical protein